MTVPSVSCSRRSVDKVLSLSHLLLIQSFPTGDFQAITRNCFPKISIELALKGIVRSLAKGIYSFPTCYKGEISAPCDEDYSSLLCPKACPSVRRGWYRLGRCSKMFLENTRSKERDSSVHHNVQSCSRNITAESSHSRVPGFRSITNRNRHRTWLMNSPLPHPRSRMASSSSIKD